jgi:quercetin dioxygenase-like cupin family protein
MSDSASYFSAGASTQEAAAPATWVDLNRDDAGFEMSPGLEFRPILAESMTVNVVRFQPNTVAPVHAHEEAQISLVVEGELEFEVNGEVRILGPNMAVVIPPFAPHGARTRDTTCLAVDAFHPPRRALLDAMKANKS